MDEINERCFEFDEFILPESSKKRELISRASRLLCKDNLKPELERIYQPVKRHAKGHPVHYMISSDDVGKDIAETLLCGLYENKRLSSRRYSIIEPLKLKICGSSLVDIFKTLYRVCEGGAVVIKLMQKFSEGDDLASSSLEKLEQILKNTLQFRNKTLTFILMPRASEKVKALVREHLGTMLFVELTEDNATSEAAKKYMRQAAIKDSMKIDKSLYRDVSDPSKTFSISELNEYYQHWYNGQLRTGCYTQYANFDSTGRDIAKIVKPRGNAHIDLEHMIGLTEAKSVIKQAVDYFKAQKLFKDRGITEERPVMHMVFTGSPGTAKTTVARLFAQIMKDNGLLSVGKLVEVGRSDLVGKYVGWTANHVVSKFEEAEGSVLFIDEAYSLVDDRDGLYGDEAINTIVQEMENRREHTVVIFAGYEDKMEGFLQKNPGLHSRIAFHVPFDNYTIDELYQIMELMAEKRSVSLGEDVRDKLLPIMESAIKLPEFGNGRYVRNLLDKARMKQAGRLLSKNVNDVTAGEITTLLADDFDVPPIQRKAVSRIGF